MSNRRLAYVFYFLLSLALLCLSPALGIGDDAEKILFEENFSKDLDPGWSWVRESPRDWKLDKEKKQLLIHTMPGVSLYMSARNLTNILLRTPPEVKEGPVTFDVHLNSEPSSTYEQAGIICYLDDDNNVDVIKEKKYGKWVLGFGLKKDRNSQLVGENVTWTKADVDLRLVISGRKISGWYRDSGTDPWHKMGETDLPGNGKPRIGLEAGFGPRNKENWAGFGNFRIVQPAK